MQGAGFRSQGEGGVQYDNNNNIMTTHPPPERDILFMFTRHSIEVSCPSYRLRGAFAARPSSPAPEKPSQRAAANGEHKGGDVTSTTYLPACGPGIYIARLL